MFEFFWRQDQVEDRDSNESSITRPRTDIKNGVCVRTNMIFMHEIACYHKRARESEGEIEEGMANNPLSLM